MKETTFSPNNFQEILSKITTNNGDINEVSTKYAQDLSDSHLITANMISVPLQVETKSNGITLSKATTVYGNSSHFYPTALESTDLDQISETQITYDLYDNKGNLVQTTDKSGNSVTTIWGYYQTLPIAQIVGVKYNDISSLSVVTAAISASNSDADNPANEGALLTALQNLRLASQLQGYSMTVNTYDPLVGITNTISSNGIKKSYEYDAAGRLLKVKNSDGQVLKENQYNYKH
jgi:YD repeat-containing protein